MQKPGTPGEKILVGFRPECLIIVEDHPLTESNVLQATLQSSTFLGDQFVFSVVVQDRLLVGKNRTLPVCRKGQLCLRVDPADVMVFPADEKKGMAVLEPKEVHPVAMMGQVN